jgi:capsular polysaccharide biosynthesis protein
MPPHNSRTSAPLSSDDNDADLNEANNEGGAATQSRGPRAEAPLYNTRAGGYDSGVVTSTDYPPPGQQYPPASTSNDLASTAVVSSIGRHKFLIVLLALLLAGAGVAAGVVRKPIYAASSSLQVGKVNPNSPGFSGYLQSVADLAANYSRSITATQVLNRIHARTGLPPAIAASRLSAEPIPNSSVFRIIATGPDSPSSIRLANQAANAVVAYEARYNFNSDAAAAFGAFQRQAIELAQAQAKVSHLSSVAGARNPTSTANTTSTTPSNQNGTSPSPALIRAQAAENVAQMRATALAATYQQDIEAQPSSNLVSNLGSAVTSTSDRTTKIELFGLIGLIVGLLTGSLLAVLREQYRRQPRLA